MHRSDACPRARRLDCARALVFLSALLGSTAAVAQTSPWSTGAPLLLGRTASTASTAGGLLYQIGGSPPSGSSTTSVEAYDSATDQWAFVASTLVSRALTRSTQTDGHIYVTGGCLGSDCRVGVTNQMEMYDPAADMWTYTAPMPTARFDFVFAAVAGKLHAAGGVPACPPCAPLFDTHEVYDPATDTWTTAAPLPVAMSAVGAAVDETLYAIQTTGDTSSLVFAYDATTDSWSTRAPMPGGGASFAFAVLNGKIHVLGGVAGATVPTMHRVYDPVSDSWSTDADLPTGVQLAPAATLGNQIHVLGGSADGSASTLHQVFSATLTNSVALTVSEGGNGAGTVTSAPAGINCGPASSGCEAVFPPGTQVTLTAAAAAGSVFHTWTGCDQAIGLSCSLLLSTSPRTVAATFLKLLTVTVATNGTGTGTVTSNPRGINCGPAATPCAALFPSESLVTLTATPATASSFGGWSGCDSVAGNVCTVVLSFAERTATATFIKGQGVGPPAFDGVSITRIGTGTGSIISDPPGINCAPDSGNPCSATFARGTQVTLTALPTIYSDFGGWGGCGNLSGLSCTFSVTGPRTLSVLFNGGTPVSRDLQVSVIGSGSGLVISNPGGISCPTTCLSTFQPIQQIVVLTAIPSTGSHFGGWIGCDFLSGTDCTVYLSNVTLLVTAKFTKRPP